MNIPAIQVCALVLLALTAGATAESPSETPAEPQQPPAEGQDDGGAEEIDPQEFFTNLTYILNGAATCGSDTASGLSTPGAGKNFAACVQEITLNVTGLCRKCEGYFDVGTGGGFSSQLWSYDTRYYSFTVQIPAPLVGGSQGSHVFVCVSGGAKC